MFLLAIEQSTSTGSIALFRDGSAVASEIWEETSLRNQQLFTTLPVFLEKAAVSVEQLDAFAVDLGPGSFGGLRIALSAARGLALPGGKKVFGVAAPEAVAWDFYRKGGNSPLVVVGDARRDFLWKARFSSAETLPAAKTRIELIRKAELAAGLEQEDTLATPDWGRLGNFLNERSQQCRLISGSRVPSAIALGELALRRHAVSPGLVADLSLIYMHPPVSVAPKFV